ncbi:MULTISPECIES: DUF6973 domain-containing protein [Mycolicibacterium]|uniref:Uncharacterized protein n=1 Tax=Mycolicibacterium senegalense TaxID=1796 RepID=A0A378SWD6_9MYCO|nr:MULTISPECIES: EspA/EspE family type VII secretion system effector [Mycolicibacterium]MCV7334099.1 hypothetical protein [Mycolicibacterium senegalense]MDR7292151.1 hypothetical protein [Mycolicibacterium senegalense]CDP88629.1 hypothetical protein BN975_04471 [Mycolicibacterium farcinogenes]STZ52822.1 Uncharacterised protein [Mycolicibacterium senegalense]
MGDNPWAAPVSVLEAFLKTSRMAQSNFGSGTPQPGTPLFESSATVRAVESDMAGTIPSDSWTGTASEAYLEANNRNIAKMGAFAALDQRLGSQIDASAYVVKLGREDLLSVHNQVVDLAKSVPPGPLREKMLLPIVAAGMGQISEIISRTTADLSDIGNDITEIADGYQKLGAGEAAGSTLEDDPRKKLEEILREYQVKDDRMLPKWLLDTIGGVLGDEVKGDANLTVGEYRVLAELAATQGPLAVKDFFDIKQAAIDEAGRKFPPPDGNTSDNHTDAFRHTYWNALMTQRFGEEWTRKFATAHERRPGDPAPREAMDLYNNEIGRQIGMANPKASPEELAAQVESAVRGGDTVIVSEDGAGLTWSNDPKLPIGLPGGDPKNAPPGDPTPYPTEGRTPGVPA